MGGINMILKLIEKLNVCNGDLKLSDREIRTIRTALRVYNSYENALDEELEYTQYLKRI